MKTNQNMIIKTFMRLIVMKLLIISILLFNGCNGSNQEAKKEKEMVKITVNYEKVAFTSNTPMNVYIGDKKIGRQEAGTKVVYKVELEKGTHEFYLKTDTVYKTDKIEFVVNDDNTEVYFGAKTRLTFGVEVWENKAVLEEEL